MTKQENQKNIKRISNDVEKVAHIPKYEENKLIKQGDILLQLLEWQKMKKKQSQNFLLEVAWEKKMYKIN